MVKPPLSEDQSDSLLEFRLWFTAKGGWIHPDVEFTPVPSGLSVIATNDIPTNSSIVRCPFSLAVTPDLAASALACLGISSPDLNERQLICSYLCFHRILDDSSRPAQFAHTPYIGILPSPDKLRTPLHFTSEELEAFRGSNLYAASVERTSEWRAEWEQCRRIIEVTNQIWGLAFEWDYYLTAATYISSRAFPSSVLSLTPTLDSNPSTYPVLLPGIDSLNHSRGQPVTWMVSGPGAHNSDDNGSFDRGASISIDIRKPVSAAQEVLNNYGAKPNSELILGYGFSIPQNPDDTILLKIGGISGKKWEVGRHAKGIQGVWEEVKDALATDGYENTYQADLEAAEVLEDMVVGLVERLPNTSDLDTRIRPEVTTMLRDYVEGQKDILDSMIQFAGDKTSEAIQSAREMGIELVFEGDSLGE